MKANTKKNFELIAGILLIFIFSFGCKQDPSANLNLFTPDNQHIRYTGRIDFSNPKKPKLSNAGAYFEAKFKGNTCEILLEDQELKDNHNYISAVIDGKYLGRIKMEKNKTKYGIAKNLKNTSHTLLICKATESQIGYVEFSGIRCVEILPLKKDLKRKIEFIGNSITCGMGLDTSEIPCGTAQWFEQHNAYLAYGPLVARELQSDWLLSSVSGIGIVRNWNSPGPVMPDVYDNLYLNTDSSVVWEAKRYIPDLISICLGTNDFSDGDGPSPREEVDSSEFVNKYILFVKYIRNRYPQAKICCLTSPMLSGKKSTKLKNYLTAVLDHMQQTGEDKDIYMFVFPHTYVSGCGEHPVKEEHQKMANELLPFFKKVMGW